MKKEKKQKLGPLQREWVRALRSGKFKQTIHCLSDGEKHCCLGVACEVAVKHGMIEKHLLGLDRVSNKQKISFGRSMDFLPKKVVKALKFIDDLGGFKASAYDYAAENYDTEEETLAELNDTGKVGFKDIADLVEKFPSAFFKGEA